MLDPDALDNEAKRLNALYQRAYKMIETLSRELGSVQLPDETNFVLSSEETSQVADIFIIALAIMVMAQIGDEITPEKQPQLVRTIAQQLDGKIDLVRMIKNGGQDQN